MNRVLQIVSWVISLAVLAIGVCLLVVWPACAFDATRLWAATGHWPAYGNPDPMQLPPSLQPQGGAGLVAVFLLELLGAWVLRRVPSPRLRVAAATLMSAAAFGVGLLLMWWDPLGVVEWAYD